MGKKIISIAMTAWFNLVLAPVRNEILQCTVVAMGPIKYDDNDDVNDNDN